MSRSIDERVVDMRFNNREFERGISESLISLDSLKKGLNMDGATKGFEDISKAAREVDVSSISAGLDAVKLSFSALQVIGMTVLSELTRSAMQMGKSLVDSTLGIITAGGKQRALDIEQAKFMFKGLGMDIEASMNSAREAVLGTAYGLDEAAKVASQLGASGMQAGDEMTTTLRAIAGVAAMTSSSYGDIGDIFTTVAGNGKLMTIQLRQMSYRGMNAAAVLAKSMGVTEAAVRDMVTDGKISFEMFSKAMADAFGEHATSANQTFTGSLSNMRAALKRIGADVWTPALVNFRDVFNSLTPVLNNVHKALGPVITAITSLIDKMSKATIAKLEGMDLSYLSPILQSMVDTLENVALGISSILKPIRDGFRDIFPPATGEKILGFVNGLKELASHFKIGDEASDKLRRTFAGLFAVVDLLKQAFGFVIKVVGNLFGAFAGPSANGILSVTAKLGDFLVRMNEVVTKSDVFNRAFTKLQNAFTTIADKIKDAIHRISEAFKGFRDIDTGPLDEFSEKTEKRLRPFERIGKLFSAVFEAIVKVLEWAAPIVKKLGQIVSQALGKLADNVSNAVQNMQFKDIFDLINTGLFTAILVGFRKFINGLTSITKDTKGFLGSITSILDGVRGSLQAYQSQLKSKTLLTIALAIGVLAASLVALSTISSKDLTKALGGISVLFVELSLAMIALNKGLMGIKMAKISVQMVAMGTAILILSHAMQNLAALDWEGIAKGTVGIAVLASTLVIAANSLQKSTGKLIRGATGLIAFSAAILVMTHAVENLSKLSWEDLAKGLTGLTVILAEVVALTHLMGNPKRMVSTGVGMIALSEAMVILAAAMKKMGELSWDEIARGLVAMAGALTEITLAMNLLPKGMINKATALIILSEALKIMASALDKYGEMDWDEIARGLVAMAGSLAAIVVALNLMPKGMINKAVGLVGIATALQIMVSPIKEMAGMTWDEIARGLVMLAGSMTILSISLNAMRKGLPGAAAMLILAPALAVMAKVLKTLGSMPLDEIGTSLLALAGVFTVLGAAAIVLKPLIPTILGLSAAIALLGAGIGLIGGGVLAFATGLTALSVGATAAGAAITVIGSAVLSLIPLFFEKIGEGIIALGKVIIDGAPVIKDAFLVLLQSGLEALVTATPLIATAIFSVVLAILTALDENLPEVVDKLFSVILGFLAKLAENLPALIKAGAELIAAFLRGIFEALGGYEPENLFSLLGAITMLVAAFAILAQAKKVAKDAILATVAMMTVMTLITTLFIVVASLDVTSVLDIAVGLSAVLLSLTAVIAVLSKIPIHGAVTAVAGLGIFVGGMAVVLTALGALAQIPGLEWLIGEGARLLQTIGEAIGGFVGGIVGGFLGAMSDSFPKIGENLSLFMEKVTPFIEGTKNIDASAMNGVKALAETVLILTAAGVLDGLTSWITGGSSMVKFGEEIAAFAPYFIDYYNQIKDVDGTVVQASANAAKALGEFASNIPRHGGLLQSITGENSITDFAKELVDFGPALMDYARSVTGLDGDVVVNSANAAKALGEFASNLPNQGGVVSWFAGENTLALFAEELKVFGPALMDYARSVTGLDGSVVVNSANAAKVLSEMASNLPNQGGVVSWFAGDNTLADFGAGLSEFGPYLASYARSVTGLDSSVVINSANAAKALSELANNLPDKGGLVALFAGDNNIATFGEDVAKFGKEFSVYYDYIRDISMTQMRGVIDGVNALVEMAKNVTNADIKGLKTFSQDMQKQGDLGIESFLQAFENANSKVTASISVMVMYIVTAISNGQPIIVTQMTNVIGAMLMVILNKVIDFKNATNSLMDALIEAVSIKSPYAVSSVIKVMNNMLSAVERRRSEWVGLGKSAIDGFIEGINNGTPRAVQAAVDMAVAALAAAMSAIGAASPAKKFILMGKYGAQGFAIGLEKYSYLSENEAANLGEATIGSLSKAISNISDVIDADLDLSPTIRPVIDLTDIKEGASSIDAFLSRAQTINLEGTRGKASVAIQTSSQNRETIPIGNQAGDQIFKFEQNNYSPKALSRLDIYRNTKNQFAMLKGAVSNI